MAVAGDLLFTNEPFGSQQGLESGQHSGVPFRCIYGASSVVLVTPLGSEDTVVIKTNLQLRSLVWTEVGIWKLMLW